MEPRQQGNETLKKYIEQLERKSEEMCEKNRKLGELAATSSVGDIELEVEKLRRDVDCANDKLKHITQLLSNVEFARRENDNSKGFCSSEKALITTTVRKRSELAPALKRSDSPSSSYASSSLIKSQLLSQLSCKEEDFVWRTNMSDWKPYEWTYSPTFKCCATSSAIISKFGVGYVDEKGGMNKYKKISFCYKTEHSHSYQGKVDVQVDIELVKDKFDPASERKLLTSKELSLDSTIRQHICYVYLTERELVKFCPNNVMTLSFRWCCRHH